MVSLDSIKFNEWEIVCISSIIEHHSVTEVATAIILNGDECYYVTDEAEKMVDVSKMPAYIIDDWVNYNKKSITTKILDKYIKEFDEVGLSDAEFISQELRKLKRDLILKKLL